MCKKVIIFGFPHSGTTILRNIISHIENVFDIVKSEIFLISSQAQELE